MLNTHVPPLTFEKVLPREQELSEGQICTRNFV